MDIFGAGFTYNGAQYRERSPRRKDKEEGEAQRKERETNTAAKEKAKSKRSAEVKTNYYIFMHQGVRGGYSMHDAMTVFDQEVQPLPLSNYRISCTMVHDRKFQGETYFQGGFASLAKYQRTSADYARRKGENRYLNLTAAIPGTTSQMQ